MGNYCLVLTGQWLDGHDAATVEQRLSEAFGMELAGFRKRVFQRAPLVLSRGLQADAAEEQAIRLRELGAGADVLPDTDNQAWLRRDGLALGPLPEAELARYAQPGDDWCRDGTLDWQPWQAVASAAEPPPLPEMAPIQPPPLPAQTATPITPAAAARSPRSAAAVGALVLAMVSVLLWHALAPLAVVCALGTLLFLFRRPALRGRMIAVLALLLGAGALLLRLHPQPDVPVVQPYIARPLQPLATVVAAPSAEAHCAALATAPTSDEDRFLLTGQRLPTGRAQRQGDTYVAEAAPSVDAQCHPGTLQLYVFRHGVFIGTALQDAVDLAKDKLADFNLADDQHLRVTLAHCANGDCTQTTVRDVALLQSAGGWTLAR